MSRASGAAGPCTILLATYNRPALLRQQLTYLTSGPLPGPVIVLDSSDEPVAGKNAAVSADYPEVTYSHFPGSTPVFSKFSLGLEMVATPYCMFLPDDDFVWLEALPRLLDTLDRDPESAVAHGLYFEFHTEGQSVHVTHLIQSGADLGETDACERVVSLMCGYEALTYALYRAPVAREAFSLAAGQDSILAQELLAGTIAAAHGKVRRLPIVTHGRRAGSTLGYRRWHPLEWTAVEPEQFFLSYPPYRRVLLDVLQRIENATDIGSVSRKIDLAHLAYLASYLDHAVLRAAAKRDPRYDGESNIVEVAWDVWAAGRGPAWVRPLRSGGMITRWLRRLVRASRIRYRLQSVLGLGAETVESDGASDGSSIRYVRFHESFSTAIERLQNGGDFAADRKGLVRALTLRETTIR